MGSEMCIRDRDLVIVAVKAPAMADVARRIGPLIGPNTVVLTAMNGVPWWFLQGFGGTLSGTTLQSVDPSGVIAQHIPADRVIGCVVHASCSVDMPGVIRHHFGNGLILGEPTGADSQRLRDMVGPHHEGDQQQGAKGGTAQARRGGQSLAFMPWGKGPNPGHAGGSGPARRR